MQVSVLRDEMRLCVTWGNTGVLFDQGRKRTEHVTVKRRRSGRGGGSKA